jgi:predicted nucleic acid-binding protein
VKVLVDTCVWSKVLRSQLPDLALSDTLRELILDNRVVLIGPILQEILSGVKGKKEFVELREKFASFDSLVITDDVYVRAAEYYNLCKMHGVNGGHVDFLICAAVSHYDCALLTIDGDFKMFKKFLPIKLFE